MRTTNVAATKWRSLGTKFICCPLKTKYDNQAAKGYVYEKGCPAGRRGIGNGSTGGTSHTANTHSVARSTATASAPGRAGQRGGSELARSGRRGSAAAAAPPAGGAGGGSGPGKPEAALTRGWRSGALAGERGRGEARQEPARPGR